MKKLKLRLNFDPQISKRAAKNLLKLADFVKDKIHHNLEIDVANESYVHIGKEKKAVGVFGLFKNTKPRILICANLRKHAKNGYSGKELDYLIWFVFFHEFAHYEQFRDNKTLQERGVAVRTRSLVKEYIKWLRGN